MFKKAVVLLICFLFPQSFSFGHDYYLSVCAIFNNEGPWLKEWIEYHKLIGVEHFILYNNQSDDNYREVLYPYIVNGEVTLVDWPDRPHQGGISAWVWATQVPAYDDALRNMRGRTKWLAVIDTDEFILPLQADNLAHYLRYYEWCGAVGVCWSCYGTSLCLDIPDNKLMIECLTHRFSNSNNFFRSGKSIIQPDYVVKCSCPHTFTLVKGLKTVDTNGQPYIHESSKVLDKIVINHYFTRTLNYFFDHKLPKKLRMDNKPLSEESIKTMLEEGNEQEDLSIGKFIPALRKKMGLN